MSNLYQCALEEKDAMCVLYFSDYVCLDIESGDEGMNVVLKEEQVKQLINELEKWVKERETNVNK